MQELCLFLCTVGWWRKALLRGHGSMVGREVLSWGRADFCRGTRIGEWESEWGVIVPRDIQVWSPREVETLETFCDRDESIRFWVHSCCGGDIVWKILVLWVKFNILIFCVFFVFGGVFLVKEDKKKIDWIS